MTPIIHAGLPPFSATPNSDNIDNTPRIQAALAAAPAGGAVYLPAGRYAVYPKPGTTQDNLVIDKSVTLFGDIGTVLYNAGGGRTLTLTNPSELESTTGRESDLNYVLSTGHQVSPPVMGSREIWMNADESANYQGGDKIVLGDTSLVSDSPYLHQVVGIVESKVVELDPGVFKGYLLLDEPVLLEVPPNTAWKIGKFTWSWVSDVRVENIAFTSDGRRANYAILTNWLERASFRNVTVRDHGAAAFGLTNCRHVFLDGSCQVRNAKHGVAISGSEHVSVGPVSIDGCSTSGIHLDAPNGWVTVNGAKVHNAGIAGLWLKRSHSCVISQCVVSGSGDKIPVRIASMRHSTIANNVISGPSLASMALYWEPNADPPWYEDAQSSVIGNRVYGSTTPYLQQWPNAPATAVTGVIRAGNSFD